ncbi:MAG: GMC oxidoreductase [Phycisphaerales bacterium]
MMQSASTGAAEPAGIEEFDVCVIGAGAAGLVLAELLSSDPTPMRVCLLEAGPERFRDRCEPFVVRSLLKEHLGVNEGRVTAFGGATNTWGGGLIRLSAADFEALDGRPDTAWPMSYDSMVPHYQAIERLFGFTAGTESVVLREPAGGAEDAGVIVRRREIPVLPFRSKNFAQRFGAGLRSNEHVRILCDSAITSIHASDGEVSHVDVVVAGARHHRIVAKRFVIAAGIVNSTLLAQRVLESAGVRRDGRVPGEFFHDHLSFPIARLRPRSQWRFSRRFGYRFERGLMIGEHFDIESLGKRLPGAFLHMAFDTSTSSVLRPVRSVLNAIQRRTLKLEGGVSLREVAALLIGVPRLGIMRYGFGRLYLDEGTRILATLDLEQVPRSEWMLRRDDEGCAVAWDVAPEDVSLARQYIPVCMRMLERLNAEAAFDVEMLIPDPVREPGAFIAHVKRESEDTFHSAGGLRMGSSPDSLVDPDLRLRGVANVHVVSAAVFPRVGTSNPTLTILALAHRLCESLRSLPRGAR